LFALAVEVDAEYFAPADVADLGTHAPFRAVTAAAIGA
jgi:hypothetical protein